MGAEKDPAFRETTRRQYELLQAQYANQKKQQAAPLFNDRRMSPNEQVQAANNTRRAGGSQAAQSRAVRRRVVE